MTESPTTVADLVCICGHTQDKHCKGKINNTEDCGVCKCGCPFFEAATMTESPTTVATPRPWETIGESSYADKTAESHFSIEAANGMTIAVTVSDQVPEEAANAELIVTAVNAYDSLLAENAATKEFVLNQARAIESLAAELSTLRTVAAEAEKWIRPLQYWPARMVGAKTLADKLAAALATRTQPEGSQQ